MDQPAAISGSLVDVRNVGTHKSVRLTIHVPEEYAMRVFDAFGWPTGAKPVAVAVARLVEPSTDKPFKPRSQVAPEKRLSQQAGIAASDPVFQQFLIETAKATGKSEEVAAEYIRSFCGVTSRKDIQPGTTAENRWNLLQSSFLVWKRAPEVVG